MRLTPKTSASVWYFPPLDSTRASTDYLVNLSYHFNIHGFCYISVSMV